MGCHGSKSARNRNMAEDRNIPRPCKRASPAKKDAPFTSLNPTAVVPEGGAAQHRTEYEPLVANSVTLGSAVATAPAEENSGASMEGGVTEHSCSRKKLPNSALGLHQRGQLQRLMKEKPHYTGRGPATEFPIDRVYRCFDVQNGLLFRLVSDKRHTWAFYNDTTDYVMHIAVNFGPGNAIKALGSTQQTMLHKESGECRLELEVGPRETRVFMRGEHNGFTTSYDADPVRTVS